MNGNHGSRETDEVALRDLVVGEPAVHRVLDGDAARAKAEQLVRDIGSDPRVADVVGRVGDATTSQPDLGAPGDASVRENGPEASEIERRTQRLPASKQVTAPKLDVPVDPHADDPHRRVTDPRLHQREPGAIPPIGEVDEAFQRAQRALRDNAGRTKADHQRLAVLGATALAVGIILLALVLTRDNKPKPKPAPDDSAQIPIDTAPVETVLPGAGATSPSAAATPPTPGTVATPPTTAPDTSALPAPTGPRDGTKPPGVETNPKSSAPRPGPSQDVAAPPPKPSSDRPF